MKKTVAVLLIMLLLAASVLPAGAIFPGLPAEETEALYQKFCAHYGYEPHRADPDFGEADLFEVKGISNGFALCHAEHDHFIEYPMIYQARLDGYCVLANNWYRPDKAGISIISLTEDTVYTLEEAVSANAVDMKGVAEAFPDRVRKTGDIDGDGELSVQDVLCLQKHIAKITAIEWGLESLCADFNGDGALNLTDMIQMQKAIAKAV